jgi:Leucine-rich repeat (LRR) protein
MYHRINEIGKINPEDISIISENGLNLSAIPESVFNLHNLKRLHICNSQITSIPSEISKLTKLNELFLEHNEICEISPKVCELKKLRKIKLTGNKINDLSPLCNISSLQKLELGRNLFTKVPKEIGNLKKLKYLDLGNLFYSNNIDTLPETLAELVSLEYLSLHRANLPELGIYFGQLVNLKQLSIRNSNITSVNFDFTQLDNLKVLDLTNNNIKAIPNSIIYAGNLVEVYFDGNPIEKFPAFLEKLMHLKYLGLAGSHLTKDKLDYLRLLLPNTYINIDKGYFTENFENNIN